jgi:hypothetical protein
MKEPLLRHFEWNPYEMKNTLRKKQAPACGVHRIEGLFDRIGNIAEHPTQSAIFNAYE